MLVWSQVQSKGSCQSQSVESNQKHPFYSRNLNTEMPGDSKSIFLHWGDVLAYLDESVTHLAGFFGRRCVEAG